MDSWSNFRPCVKRHDSIPLGILVNVAKTEFIKPNIISTGH